MAAYYNELDPFAAQRLRNLIAAGHIAPGDVDERSIVEVSPDDLKGYTQCHFFAGIGGWSCALRLALWPDDRSVWTGSCPCQPFSSAGKQSRQSDERHLWPHWYRLIRECCPAVIFGEQVASAIAAGWWDDVAHDLETEGYACASAVLPACAVGAPHRRDRLWFVANAARAEFRSVASAGDERSNGELDRPMADAESLRWGEGGAKSTRKQGGSGFTSAGIQGGVVAEPQRSDVKWRADQPFGAEEIRVTDWWAGAEWIECADGKSRPVKPGLPLLAHGVPNRVGLLRGFGNAIVPQVAAQFIEAAWECIA